MVSDQTGGSMTTRSGAITHLVPDFRLIEDTPLPDGKRRVQMAPREEDDGTVVVFEDGYGAAWDLMLMRKPA